jgi:hypothetical protein
VKDIIFGNAGILKLASRLVKESNNAVRNGFKMATVILLMILDADVPHCST